MFFVVLIVCYTKNERWVIINRYMFEYSFFEKRPFLTSLFLFFLNCIPRLSAINRYITPDELMWVFRSVQFSEAVRQAQWAETIITGHPGITITWVGALAINLQQWVQPSSESAYQWIANLAWLVPDNFEALDQLALFLTAGRLLLIGLNGVGLVAVFWLVRRLFDVRVALLTAVFLALEPFFAGLGGLLHLDATMSLFAMLSLLCLALVLQTKTSSKTELWFTAVSAICTSLALLTKSPAILLVGISIFFLLIKGLFDPKIERAQRGRWLYSHLLVWGGSFLFTCLLVLPALWSSFSSVLDIVNGETNKHIGDALRPTFFGGNVAFDHPPYFYPITVAFRLSPLSFLGAFLSFGLMVRWLWHQRTNISVRWFLLPYAPFLLWTIGFLGGITLAAKKFDRYALPVFPALILFSAIGWVWMGERVAWKRPFFPILLILTIANALYFHPYPLSAYNFLLGGPAVAQAVMPIGWGEPISASTIWLEENEPTENRLGIGSIAQAIAPFYSGNVLPATEQYYPQADYIIWTQLDRQMSGEDAPQLLPTAELIHTVAYGGLPQAWVYKQPSPIAETFTAVSLPHSLHFDNRVALTKTAVQMYDHQVQTLLGWELLAGGENGRYQLRLTLTDENGVVWYETEQELVNDTYFYPQDWPMGETITRYTFNLERGTPPADYLLKVALIDEGSGSILPITTPSGDFVGTAVSVGTAVYQTHDPATNLSIFDIPNPIEPKDDAPITLLGFGQLPPQVASGAPLTVHLFWRANTAVTTNYQLQLSLGDSALQLPVSRYPTSGWQKGEIIQERYLLTMPADTPAQTLPLKVSLLDESGATVPDSQTDLAEVEIMPLDRLFTLPDDMDYPLTYQLGDGIILRGVDVGETAVSIQTITLYWEIVTPPDSLTSAFVHLIQPDGSNFAQSDQWPGGLPSDLWAEGQIIVDTHYIDLPNAPLPAELQIGVGLYTAENGVRFTAVDANGNAIPNNRIILPIPLQSDQQ